MIYLIGSLRNPEIPRIAHTLRAAGHDVFDDWYAAGPEADDKWRDYEQGRDRSYIEALEVGEAANHVFQFDRTWLARCETAVLAAPAGRSGHMELGWMMGMGKPGYVLLEPENARWDVMYRFCYDSGGGVVESLEALVSSLASAGPVPATAFPLRRAAAGPSLVAVPSPTSAFEAPTR